MAAAATMIAAATRAISPLVCIGWLSPSTDHGAALAPAQPHDPDDDGDDAHQDRNKRDIEELQPHLQPVDLLIERELHVAQLLTGLQHLAAEALERRSLLRGELDVARLVALKILDLRLGGFELVLQLVLLGAVAAVGVALDVLHDLEGAGRGAAAAQADEVVAAGERFDGVGDEIAVIG